MDIIQLLNGKGIVLNEQQTQAVLSHDENVLLLAVAGSGKTTVLVSRIANLIFNHSADPARILTLTFSTNAAHDMAKRYSDLFGKESQAPKISTIHSFCLRVVRQYYKNTKKEMPKLIEIEKDATKSKQALIRNIYMSVTGNFPQDETLTTVISKISYVKNMMLEDEKGIANAFGRSSSLFGTYLFSIYTAYEQYKKENNLIDFDDMLNMSYIIFKGKKSYREHYFKMYDYICVDEAQDTSKIQHKIIKVLCNNGEKNIFMVGDEDQSIYGFRGAYPQALLSFKNEYKEAKILKMEQNYRSNADIIAKARDAIGHNTNRYAKNMFSENVVIESSIAIIKTSDYKAQMSEFLLKIKTIPENESVAVLFRNNDSAVLFIETLLQNGIDFNCKEPYGTFLSNQYVKDIIAFLNLALDASDINSFRRIFYYLSLSRDVNIFVNENMGRYTNIFDCIADCNFASATEKGLASHYKNSFAVLKELPPERAINYVLNMLGYLRQMAEKESDVRLLCLQKTDVLKCIASKYDTISEYLNRLSLLTKFTNTEIDHKNPRIDIGTIHSSKGLEYDNVFIADAIDGIFPSKSAIQSHCDGDSSAIEEEVRLWYVGITRARKKLFCFLPIAFGGETCHSRFIDWMLSTKANTPNPYTLDEYIGRKVKHFLHGEGIIVQCRNENVHINFYNGKTLAIWIKAFEDKNQLVLVD